MDSDGTCECKTNVYFLISALERLSVVRANLTYLVSEWEANFEICAQNQVPETFWDQNRK